MAHPSPAVIWASHYPTRVERKADLWVHRIGLAAAGLGGVVLLGLSLDFGSGTQSLAIGVYAACLLATFICSAAYNLAGPRAQPILRRFDHAAIFLMIAGSYTPFTTQRLHGAMGMFMTLLVWGVALVGVFGKLFLPGLAKRIWIGLYLGLGWLAVIAVKPLIASVSALSLGLLVAGGLVYSTGILVYIRKTLKFRRAVWHGFVLAAAATQYVAILTGVVLLPVK